MAWITDGDGWISVFIFRLFLQKIFSLMKAGIRIVELKTFEEMIPMHSLLIQLSRAVTKVAYRRMLKEMLANGYRMIAAFEKNKCVGIAGFWINTKFYCDKYIEPDNVVIDKNSRSKGVGKLLINWLYDEGKKNGCRTMLLDAYVENLPAHHF